MNNNWLRNTIRSFEPYVVPEIREHTVINANESPYNLFDFPKVKADFLERLAKTPSYHYPDPFAEELRAALAKYVGCQPQEVLVGNGGDEIISLIMNTFLNPGDTLLTHTPTFDIYGIDAEVLGAKVVTVSDLDGYRRNRDGLLAKVKELQPKVTVLCNPNNPTGALYPKEILEQIVQVARENDLILFADEIYDRLVMQGEPEHIPLASLAPDLLTLCFNGLSKSHRVAGFRVGWVCLAGDKSHAKGYIEGLNLLAKMRLCSNVPAQSIIQTSLGGYQSVDEYLCPGGRLYEQRELIWKTLNSIPGLSAAKPKAAFYIFPKVDTKKFNIHSDEQMALDLLKEQKILITAGTGFNWGEPDHFRIVYLPDLVSLKEASVRLEKFFGSYRQKD